MREGAFENIWEGRGASLQGPFGNSQSKTIFAFKVRIMQKQQTIVDRDPSHVRLDKPYKAMQVK